MLFDQVLFPASEAYPTIVLSLPDVLENSAPLPSQVFRAPIVFTPSESVPTAVFVATFPAPLPIITEFTLASTGADIAPVSDTVTNEFCPSFPVVPSKRRIALSVEDQGQLKSPVPFAEKVGVEVAPALVRTVPLAQRATHRITPELSL